MKEIKAIIQPYMLSAVLNGLRHVDGLPALEAYFAARYEAKFGKKPPKPTAESGEHDHDAKS